MTFKEFDKKVDILARRLRISKGELMDWKFVSFTEALKLMEIL